MHYAYLRSVKNGSNFGASKGKTHVSRVGGGNGVHGKTTSFIGGGGKSGLGVGIDSSALQDSWLRKSTNPKKIKKISVRYFRNYIREKNSNLSRTSEDDTWRIQLLHLDRRCKTPGGKNFFLSQ